MGAGMPGNELVDFVLDELGPTFRPWTGPAKGGGLVVAH